jgi:hypothetical protein
MNIKITPEAAIALVTAGLSLFFDHFPVVAQKFDALEVSQKRLITVGLSALVGVGAFVGQCLGWFSTNLACTLPDALNLAYGIVLAVAVMYGFHGGTKPVK